MSKLVPIKPTPTSPTQASLLGYTSGFVLSLLLTVSAYLLASGHSRVPHDAGVFSPNGLILGLVGLAIVQLFVQLVFFLHLGQDSRPRLRLLAFLFALMIVIIVVVGSLWIMSNLNYHMTPQAMDDYMRAQAKKGF